MESQSIAMTLICGSLWRGTSILDSRLIVCCLKESADLGAFNERCSGFLSQANRNNGNITGGRIAIQSLCSPQCEYSSRALLHASVACHRKLCIDWVPACDLEDATVEENPDSYKKAWKLLKGADAILVPGGFGDRGVEGKILAAKYARDNSVPYLGICLGMQIAVIKFTRSILGLKNANNTEFDPNTKNPCVIFMPEFMNILTIVLEIAHFIIIVLC